MNETDEITTIRITKGTRDRLRSKGQMTDNYETVLVALLDQDDLRHANQNAVLRVPPDANSSTPPEAATVARASDTNGVTQADYGSDMSDTR